MKKNMYSYKKNFVAQTKNSNGVKYRRVFEEGYQNKSGHAIGINEVFPKKGSVEAYYKVEDTKNHDNDKMFKFGSRKNAEIYAKELKDKYEGGINDE